MQITQSLQFWSLRFKLYNAVIIQLLTQALNCSHFSYIQGDAIFGNSGQLEFRELSVVRDTLRNNKGQNTGILWQLKQLLVLGIHWQLKQICTCLRLTIPPNSQLLLWSSRTVRDSCLELWINQKCKKLFLFCYILFFFGRKIWDVRLSNRQTDRYGSCSTHLCGALSQFIYTPTFW